MQHSTILASIDMGTNSLHMVIVRIDPQLPAFTIIGREKDTVRLGDREPGTGRLTPEAMERTLQALRRFLKVAQTLNAQQVIAVATSAVREAPNGREFLKRVEEEIGLFVDLISGQEEARRIYLGVLSGMEFTPQPQILIDIGGGSTELILADTQEAKFLSSTKVGAVRLTAELVNTDPIHEIEFLYLQAYARAMMERAVEELQSQLKPGEIPRLIGTSGTIETLATLQARELLGIVPTPLTGYQLTLPYLQDLVSRLRRMTNAERAMLPGMNDRRSEIILAGAVILQETMSLLGVERLTVCERSLREGVIVDWMLSHGLIEDHLRYQSSVRERSVMKIAHKYQVKVDYSDRVAKFALEIFDQTQGYLHSWGEEERQLLWAAAILHNCGHFISHSSHHKHSYYLIRYGELLGYSEAEVEAIANIARYHRKSPPKKKHEVFNNLPTKSHRLMVSQLSAMLRLGVALDRRQLGAIQKIYCDYRPSVRELHLKLFATQPQDDCALELWSLEYKKEVFEQEFSVKLLPSLVKAFA